MTKCGARGCAHSSAFSRRSNVGKIDSFIYEKPKLTTQKEFSQCYKTVSGRSRIQTPFSWIRNSKAQLASQEASPRMYKMEIHILAKEIMWMLNLY